MNMNEQNISDLNQEDEYVEENTSSKKESFASRNRFGLGVVTGVASVCLLLFGVWMVLGWTGSLLVLGGTGFHKVDNSPLLDEKTVDKLNTLYQYLNVYYYEDFEIEDIRNSLFDGLMAGVNDPYTVYYTKEEYEDMTVSTSGTYYGIGAGLSQDAETMKVTITKVYAGTPAEEAGLENGDEIITVADIDATSMDVSALVHHIRGEEGTTVHMVIYRASTGETLEFDVERRNVVLPSVEEELLEGGIGYIQVTGFQEKTATQFMEKVEKLQEQGMKGVIIDLRANPGGYLRTAVDMLDYILPEGTITYTEDAYGNRNTYYSKPGCLDMPIVLLVDGNSASASEIFAGAIKDYQYGTIVGTTTFGKGIVQQPVELEDGDAIKLTISRYFTPNGNYIHGVGIEPDVVVEYDYTGPEDESYDKQYDSQFLKAVEVMKGLLTEE